MKKVLMICYNWHSLSGVGAFRSIKFAKYLPHFEWHPTVLTPLIVNGYDTNHNEFNKSDNIRVLDTLYDDRISRIKIFFGLYSDKATSSEIENFFKKGYGWRFAKAASKLVHLLREYFTLPDECVGWYRHAVKSASELLKQEKFDLIYSSSPPETSHLIAKFLKNKFSIPWVADLRDLWSLYHYVERGYLKSILVKIMERHCLKNADAIITVSEPWANLVSDFDRLAKDKVHVVYNGYDEDDFQNIEQASPENFTLTYAGKLHRIHQNPEILFEAVSQLIEGGSIDRNKISINFYLTGYFQPDIKELIRKYQLENIVSYHSPIPHTEIVKVFRHSSMLLFFHWTGKYPDGWYSAKIYDYLGSRRPVLAICKKEGVVVNLIKETQAGYIVKNLDELKNALVRFYTEYLYKGDVAYKGDEMKIAEYSRKNATDKLAGIFNSCCK